MNMFDLVQLDSVVAASAEEQKNMFTEVKGHTGRDVRCVYGSAPGACVSMEIEDDRVGGGKRGVVPVSVFLLSFSPHVSRNRVPETRNDV